MSKKLMLNRRHWVGVGVMYLLCLLSFMALSLAHSHFTRLMWLEVKPGFPPDSSTSVAQIQNLIEIAGRLFACLLVLPQLLAMVNS